MGRRRREADVGEKLFSRRSCRNTETLELHIPIQSMLCTIKRMLVVLVKLLEAVPALVTTFADLIGPRIFGIPIPGLALRHLLDARTNFAPSRIAGG